MAGQYHMMLKLIELFWIDRVYSALIVLSCLYIYWKTRELYELSLHEGIKYFRYTFLFFGVSFFLHFIETFFIYLRTLPHPLIRTAIVFLTVYSGSMAVLSLLYSLLWKRLKWSGIRRPFVALNLLAIFISASTIYSRVRPFILLFSLLLYAAGTLLAYTNYLRSKERRRSSRLFLLYLLLFLSWIANTVSFFAIHISFTVVVVLKTLSAGLFLLIVYRVHKITGVG